MLGGTTRDNVVELHKKYGDVVRVSPNEISSISGETAWQDIYGFRVGQLKGQLNMQKDPVWLPIPVNGTPSIMSGDDEAHSRGRRVLSHAFSEKALAEQEPLLTRFVDLLVDGPKDTITTGGGPQDMTDWYVSCDSP
jgi:cytochrome P450